jgi:hypothetical protein
MEGMIGLLVYGMAVVGLVMAVLILILAIVILIFELIAYVVQGKAMYAMARRRGVPYPWMAWVPFCNIWMLGAISDHFQLAVYGTERKRGRKLLILYIIMVVFACQMIGFALAEIYVIASFEGNDALQLLMAANSGIMEAGMIVACVFFSVDYYKALFDLYRSSDPDRSILYLMLSIFIQFTTPFFIYSCRNKDDGMTIPPELLPENT